MNLSLNDAEREHLSALGVGQAPDGTLRSASGREVSAATAVALLQKAAVSQQAERGIRPGDFRRGYLTEGHQAQHAQGIGGVPSVQQGALPRPDLDDSDGAAGDDIDGSGNDGPDDLAKMTPQAFRRHYLAAGHAAESPAITGRRGTTAVPETSHQAEPQHFGRGYLAEGHASPSPASDFAGNNPHAPGTPAAEVLATAAGNFGQIGARSRSQRLTPSGFTVSEPAPARSVMPPGMRASAVPAHVTVAATRAAPGER